MSVSTKVSFLISTINCVFIFSLMQTWKTWLTSSNPRTLLGGLLGTYLFIFVLTAVGNLAALLFGKSYNIRLFPEVIFAMLMAVSASASIHRICGTSCLLLSMLAMYYINKHSQKVYAQSVQQPAPTSKKRKN